MRMRIGNLGVATVAAVLFLTACGSGANETTTAEVTATTQTQAPAEPVEITIGTGFNGVQYADIYASIELGYFEEEGIIASFLASGTPTGTALLSGESQINSGQPAATYIPNEQGADLVAIYSPAATFETWVAEDPIKSVADLAGTTMGVFNLQDLDVMYTKWMLEQAGLTLDDVELIASGGSSQKFASVIAGAVDSAPVYAPVNFLADDENLNLVFDTRQLDVGQVPTFYIVSRAWAEENHDIVVGFIRALNRAHEWLFDSSNKEQAVEIIAEYTGVETRLVEVSYDLYFTNPGELYSINGEWERSIVELMAEEMVEIGLLENEPVPYESTVAPEFREEALGD